ncbi:MAG: hypothetical protein MJZ33_05480 [Paludibacteraceae bacterium]|nr:hypothetical protein [Paludibacteraceae bacterium]
MKKILNFLLKKKSPTEKVGLVVGVLALCVVAHGASHLFGIADAHSEGWMPFCELIGYCPFS